MIETFRRRADLTDMRATTISITAEDFEKVFVRSAIKRIGSHATTKHRLAWTDWRDIARKALRNIDLGDALRNAVLPLPAKYREVLFLRDVKNLDSQDSDQLRSRILKVAIETSEIMAFATVSRRKRKS